jgi:predicted protein tyrosine phosphatase
VDASSGRDVLRMAHKRRWKLQSKNTAGPSPKHLRTVDSQQPSHEAEQDMATPNLAGNLDALVHSDSENTQSPQLIGEEGTTPWKKEHLPLADVPCVYCNEGQWSKYKPDFQVADLGDGLFISACDPAFCPYYLEKLGITHILQVFKWSEHPEKFTGYRYLTIAVNDSPDDAEKLASDFETAFEFISQGRRYEKGKVLVHCIAGISRSATVCIAYLMKERGLSLEAARQHVKRRRSCIQPNEGFEEQLRIFEQTLQNPGQKDTELKTEDDEIVEEALQRLRMIEYVVKQQDP